MADARTTLPDLNTLDVEALRTLVLEQHAQLLSRHTEIDNLNRITELLPWNVAPLAKSE